MAGAEPLRPPSAPTAPMPPGQAHRWSQRFERLFSIVTGTTAIIPLAALVAMLVVLFVEAWPAIRFSGGRFLTSSVWTFGSVYGALTTTHGIRHLAGASFGAYPLIIGTLESSAIALVIGLPVAVGAAILVVEKLPPRIAAAVGICLEILAGIPSVVIGVWGALTFGPWVAKNVYPALTHLPNFPPFDIFRGSPGSGEGLLTSSFVLAAMIIPIIAATTRDLLRQVPETTVEGAEALGMTDAEVFWRVHARWVRAGVIGAAVLGLGRALGETIAVAIISGAQDHVVHNIYGVFSTVAAFIVSNLDAAQTDPSGLAVRSLAEMALALLVITLLANVVARLIVRRSSRGAALPVGAGF